MPKVRVYFPLDANLHRINHPLAAMRSLLLSFLLILLLMRVASPAPAAKAATPDTLAAVDRMFPNRVSPYLEKFGETALGEWPNRPERRYSPNSMRYRITRLQPGKLLCLRIYQPIGHKLGSPEAATEVIVKEGGFSRPDPEGTVLAAPAAELDQLLQTFADQELFSLPEKKLRGPAGFDGSTWIFERWDVVSGYKIVGRWMPTGPSKASAEAVEKFLERAQKAK